MIYVVYVKITDGEYVFAFLDEKLACDCAKHWGKHAMILPMGKPNKII